MRQSDQRRDSRTEERSITIVEVEPAAGRKGNEPCRRVFVLCEQRGCRERVIESRYVVISIPFQLKRGTRGPRVWPAGTADGRFAEEHLLPITLQHGSELAAMLS